MCQATTTCHSKTQAKIFWSFKKEQEPCQHRAGILLSAQDEAQHLIDAGQCLQGAANLQPIAITTNSNPFPPAIGSPVHSLDATTKVLFDNCARIWDMARAGYQPKEENGQGTCPCGYWRFDKGNHCHLGRLWPAHDRQATSHQRKVAEDG